MLGRISFALISLSVQSAVEVALLILLNTLYFSLVLYLRLPCAFAMAQTAGRKVLPTLMTPARQFQ